MAEKSQFGGIPVDESQPPQSKFGGIPIQDPPAPAAAKRDVITGAVLGGPNAPIGEQPASPSGLFRTLGETLKGAGKELGSTAYGLATGPAAGPVGMGLGYLGKKTGLTPKVEAAMEPSNTSQQIGKYGTMAGEMLTPLPGAKANLSDKVLPGMAEHLYQRALKPPVTGGLDATKALVRTGLQERIPVTEKGLAKNLGNIDTINQQIGKQIGNSGVTVDPASVARRVDEIRPSFESQVNPKKDLDTLGRVKAEYLAKHTTQAPFTRVAPGTEEEAGRLVPIGQGSTPMLQDVPAMAAHGEKVGTYRQLAGKYGELGNADVEGQKALARGDKEELGRQIPSIVPQLAREGRAIDLQGPLERAVMRGGNRDIVPIGGTQVSLAKKLLDNPALKSHAALALSRAGEMPLNYRGLIPVGVRVNRLVQGLP